MPVPDLLRLLAVPVLAWAAWHDVRTRRVPSWIWYPLVALGVVLLAWDYVTLPPDPYTQRLFLVRVGLSVGLLGVLGLGFWYVGGFGGADAKAFFTIGVLFPTVPAYVVGPVVLPLVSPPLGVFSLTVLTDAVLLGVLFPAFLALGNAANGRFGLRGFLYRPVAVDDLLETAGSVPVGSAPDDSVGRRLGYYLSMLDPRKDRLDLDALRMYLRWRGLALAELRECADHFRDPATLPAEPNPPGDGSVEPPDADCVGVEDAKADGGAVGEAGEAVAEEAAPETVAPEDAPDDDPWGAAAFLAAIDHGAYGTTPEKLRDGLDVLAREDEVWISPGIPFVVPLFFGTVVALTYGDLLFGALAWMGVA